MGLSVAVAGASGYAGGELLRLLDAHPDLSVDVVTASSNAGELVTSVHPHLPQFAGRVFEAVDVAALAAADVVFLALPHGQSAAIVAQLPDHQLVVDLGADFRLRDASRGTSSTAAPTPAPGPTACPSCPARAAGSR